jgi:glyoxylase-like metal-dependent hydrolase (beta-lactamase superfamily II)
MVDETFEASPGIWCVRFAEASCYLVRLLPGGILVDTGPDPTGALVMTALQQARVGLASLRAILLTHADFEASAGAARLTSRSGAPVLVSEGQRALLRDERGASGWSNRMRLGRKRTRAQGVETSATQLLRDGELVRDVFEAVSLRASTSESEDGHFTFYFRPTGALFSGDAIDTSALPWRVARGQSTDALRERLPGVTAVFPNHEVPQTDPDQVRERWLTMEPLL